MSDFTDWKDTLTKEPDSGKKYYAVGCNNASDWVWIDSVLKQDGSNEPGVPSESITCPDSKDHSETRAIYLLTDDEAVDIGFRAYFHFMPIEPNCANWLNMTAQLLKSPDYPTIDCSWVITAPSTESTINIHFENFEVKCI